jgi:AcrR family transcriptional regulator
MNSIQSMATTSVPATSDDRRKRRKTERRDAILAAARKVFAEKGFEGTTIADVARKARVAAGTVYLYFESKTELFAALNGLLFETINQAMIDAKAPPDLASGTKARVHAVFESCANNRDLLRLIFLNPDPRTEVARRMKHREELREQPLVDLLRAGMTAGVVREGDPRLLTRIVNGLVTIALYQCFVQSDGAAKQAYEDTVVDMIVAGLSPK